MTEGQTLFLILSLLYLSECVVWMGKRAVLFSAWWGSGYRIFFASERFGNNRGGLALLNPFSLLGSNFLGHWIPLSISPKGVCAFTLQTIGDTGRPFQTGKVLRFEEISDSKADGKYLWLNESRFVKCGDAEQSASLAKWIQQLSSKSAENREASIRRTWSAQFSKEDALKCHDRVISLAAGIRWNCFIFFVLLYGVAPIMASTYGLIGSIIPVAIVMLTCALFISVSYFYAHKVLYPSLSNDRLVNFVKMILCPPAAIRAADFLTLHAMSRFHPVLLANIIFGSHNEVFTRAVIKDMQYPIRHDLTDPVAVSIVSWHASCEIDACKNFLEAENSAAFRDFLTLPNREGDSSAYCPRCSCQFKNRLDECPDCPGVKLLLFSDS